MNEKKESISEEQAVLFSVLSDPTRLKLLKVLAQQKEDNALCVNDLASFLGITQSAVSQHLRVLRTAGLVKGRRHGYRIHYFVNTFTLMGARAQLLAALTFTK